MLKTKFFYSILFLFIFQENIFAQNYVNSSVGNFHFLYLSIRNGEIADRVAQDSIKSLLPQITTFYNENKAIEDSTTDKINYFPVEGYGMNMIGGKRGSDYVPGNYNFYNTSRISCHPAHDIFILDKNQDFIDDQTQLPVNILSFSDGVVISVEYFWDTLSTKKGGNFIYIYEPKSKIMYYYAHNDVVFVQLGDIVKAGQNIATMGRTGLNAYKKRSPTHLHFSMLQFDENANAKPIKPYFYLEKAKRK